MNLRTITQRLLSRAQITLDGPASYDPQVRDESVFRDVFIQGSLGLGDAYTAGKWECEKLDEFFTRVTSVGLEHDIGMGADWVLRIRDWVMNLQSIRRALHVAELHYDLGNALYERMLGESMGYSSAYFSTASRDLTEAQYAKFDRICTELGLKPGMKVLEIGCGWGTFAAYAAERYGVEVLGVTVSKEQLAYAESRCKGLPVTFYFGDYRTLPKDYEGTFDAAVSIEMIEAVGPRNLRSYMSVASRMLKPKGAFMVQAIIGNGVPDVWISTRIFPNGVLPSMEQIVASMRHLFRISSLESFGPDYDTTLMLWDERFRAQWNDIKEIKNEKGEYLYNERFYRMWHYYLMICAGAFRSRKIDVCQLLLTKEGVS